LVFLHNNHAEAIASTLKSEANSPQAPPGAAPRSSARAPPTPGLAPMCPPAAGWKIRLGQPPHPPRKGAVLGSSATTECHQLPKVFNLHQPRIITVIVL